jgi:hypothetical protein
VTFFREIEKSIQTHMEKQTNKQKSQKAKAILCKISNAGCITIPNFKLYCRAMTIITA